LQTKSSTKQNPAMLAEAASPDGAELSPFDRAIVHG
jgi:hypothetical protein